MAIGPGKSSKKKADAEAKKFAESAKFYEDLGHEIFPKALLDAAYLQYLIFYVRREKGGIEKDEKNQTFHDIALEAVAPLMEKINERFTDQRGPIPPENVAYLLEFTLQQRQRRGY